MPNHWPMRWAQDTLKAAGITETHFALEAMSAWRKSTPLEAWTNNPIGMPARGNNVPTVHGTLYAQFPSFGDFRRAFQAFTKTRQGAQIAHTLDMGESWSDLWREIHALKWPADTTETDYPSVILDRMEADYRNKLQTRQKADRKTSGTVVTAPPDVHAAMRNQALVMSRAAEHFGYGAKAIEHVIRSLNDHG